MPQVALSSDFLKAFAEIPRGKQKAVRDALEKFKRDPTSAAQNYEKIRDVEDDKVRTVRCGIDYRAIVIHPNQGDVHLFVWVDHHDEAMAWARKKRFEVNKHTGTLQVYEVQTAVAAAPVREVPSIDSESIPKGRLFSGYDNTTLLLFGVPEPLLIAVRALREEADLDGLAPYLPQEASDALYLLAAGYTAEATIDELDRKKPVNAQKPEFDPEDFEAALERPGTKQQFKVVADDHELADILNAPLAQWRIFLHPSQTKLVEMNSTGPARVLGGAGTGKTVVAMHRARKLALTCPAGKKILFTTFTTNLAADIQSLLTSLCGKEFEQIEVTNLHAWARSVLQARGIKVRTTQEAPDKEVDGWNDAYAVDAANQFPETFYRHEWSEVVQAQGILDEAAYLRARRAGRGTRLSREQRKQVWQVLAAYRRFLQSHGLMDPADTIREARLLLQSGKVPHRYAAIVADEVQDFSESELTLLRAMVPEGPNDLFLVGDAHQRIYGHKASLSRCGINVRGLRSRRLRLNYRTTQGIRNWSVAVLRGMSVDDLDEGTDDALKGYHSLRQGGPPLVVHHATEKDEAAFVVERIRLWTGEQGRRAGDICVAARTKDLLDKRYGPLLRDAGFSVQFIKRDETKLGDGIRLATMHRVKGLEFPCVLIAGVQAGTVPLDLKSYVDETDRQDHIDTEKRLLFVAATRARDELVVTGFGSRSEFLKDLRAGSGTVRDHPRSLRHSSTATALRCAKRRRVRHVVGAIRTRADLAPSICREARRFAWIPAAFPPILMCYGVGRAGRTRAAPPLVRRVLQAHLVARPAGVAMPSTFSWLDHSDRERRRVLDAIDKFKETDTRDELGLGSLRDGFADLFFPGTSTIQTRARYFLFVPWICRRAEAKGTAERFAMRVRREEVRLSEALLKTEDSVGAIGKIKGAATKRLPSSLYWLGLASWQIRMFSGSQEDYYRSFEQRQRRARDVVRDDDGDRVDGRGALAWHPHLPPPPTAFPEVASFALTREEARYLEERIIFAKPASLIAFLVREGRTLEGDFPWAHPQFASFPLRIREALEHARLLSETAQGAALLYNLMLSEEQPPGGRRDELVEQYRSRLSGWCEELRHRENALQHWDRAAFWHLAHELANVRSATRDFVDAWVNLRPWRALADVADGPVARALIRDRELRLKGKARARLGNLRALENWSGEAGTAPLSYRWGPAVRILSDIHAAKDDANA